MLKSWLNDEIHLLKFWRVSGNLSIEIPNRYMFFIVFF